MNDHIDEEDWEATDGMEVDEAEDSVEDIIKEAEEDEEIHDPRPG